MFKVHGFTPDGWESLFWTYQNAYQCALGGMCNFKGAVRVAGDYMSCEVLSYDGKVLATYRVAIDPAGRVAPWAKSIPNIHE
jgi:hypothetical protein